MRATPSILLASLTTLLLGCSDATGPSRELVPIRPPGAPETQSLLIAPASALLQSGESRQFTAAFATSAALSAGPIPVTWASTNGQVASVSSAGIVQGVSGGEVQISATWAGYRATALVTVVGPWKKVDGPTPCILRTHRASNRNLSVAC